MGPSTPQCRNVWYPWVPDSGDPAGVKPLLVPATTRSAPKRGSAKGDLARGYRLTFAMTGLGWADHSQLGHLAIFEQSKKESLNVEIFKS